MTVSLCNEPVSFHFCLRFFNVVKRFRPFVAPHRKLPSFVRISPWFIDIPEPASFFLIKDSFCTPSPISFHSMRTYRETKYISCFHLVNPTQLLPHPVVYNSPAINAPADQLLRVCVPGPGVFCINSGRHASILDPTLLHACRCARTCACETWDIITMTCKFCSPAPGKLPLYTKVILNLRMRLHLSWYLMF